VWDEVHEWISACNVMKIIKNSRVGVMGHYYNGMLDVYSDITMFAAAFGCQFELIEFGILKRLREDISASDIRLKLSKFRDWFNVSDECSGDELEQAALSSVALDRLAEKLRLGALAYYYEVKEIKNQKNCYYFNTRNDFADRQKYTSRRGMRDKKRPGDEDNGFL